MISNTGFWTFNGPKFDREHFYDPQVSNALLGIATLRNIKRSYDFGCGKGEYVHFFRQNGIEALGFDGNPNTANIPYCNVQDLTDPTFSIEPVDFLTCLEVCEHVPKEHEDALLSTLDRHIAPNGTLVLSWAIVGQGGLGHVNCQNNDYVISKLQSMGYTYNLHLSDVLRKCSTLSWFKNTILVLNKHV
jgi:hypothetical protein